MMETKTEIEEKEKKMMEIGGEEEKKTEQIVAKLLAQASIEDGQGEQCCAAGSSGTSAAIEEAEEELATNSHSGELDADKQKCQFQIWLNENGNCLYPTREQKQRLAEKMGIDFVKVNLWRIWLGIRGMDPKALSSLLESVNPFQNETMCQSNGHI
jgi:hypothetical protein